MKLLLLLVAVVMGIVLLPRLAVALPLGRQAWSAVAAAVTSWRLRRRSHEREYKQRAQPHPPGSDFTVASPVEVATPFWGNRAEARLGNTRVGGDSERLAPSFVVEAEWPYTAGAEGRRRCLNGRRSCFAKRCCRNTPRSSIAAGAIEAHRAKEKLRPARLVSARAPPQRTASSVC